MERDSWDDSEDDSGDYLEEGISLISTQLSLLSEVVKDQSNPNQFQNNIEVVVEEKFKMVVHEALQTGLRNTNISQFLLRFQYKWSPHTQILNLILLKNILTQYEDSQNMLSSVLKKVDLVLLLKNSIKPLTKKQAKKQIFHILLLITQRRDNSIYEHVVKKNIKTVNKVVSYMLESKEKIFNQFALAICHRLLQEQSSVAFLKYFLKQKMLTRVFQVIKNKKIKHHSKILCGIIYETTKHQTDFCYSKSPHIYFCEKQMANILRFLVHNLKKQNSNFMTLNIIRNNCLQLFEHYNSKEFVLKNKKVFLQLLVISKDFLEEFKVMFKSVLHFNLLSRSEIEPYLRIYGTILKNQYQETICTDMKVLILILNLEGVIIRRLLEPLKQIITRVLDIIDGRINTRQDDDNMITLFQSLLKSNQNILVEKNYKQIAERCGDIFNHLEEKSADRFLNLITECLNPILFNFHRQKMGKQKLSSIQAQEIAGQYYNKFGLNNVARLSAEARK